MMKVFVFIAVATFLVVDTSATLPSVEERASWALQCRNETGSSEFDLLSTDVADQRKVSCFSACYFEKAGLIQDGKLAEREKVAGDLAEAWSSLLGAHGLQPKEGRTFRQLAEKCYDEGNAKTEKCEIAGAISDCLNGGVHQPVRDSGEKKTSEDSDS